MEIFYCCFSFYFHFHFVFVCRLCVAEVFPSFARAGDHFKSKMHTRNAPGVPLLKFTWCLTLHCSTLLRLLSKRIIFVYIRFKFHLWDAMHACVLCMYVCLGARAFFSISNRFSFTHRTYMYCTDSSVNINTAMIVRKVRLRVRAHSYFHFHFRLRQCAHAVFNFDGSFLCMMRR